MGVPRLRTLSKTVKSLATVSGTIAAATAISQTIQGFVLGVVARGTITITAAATAVAFIRKTAAGLSSASFSTAAASQVKRLVAGSADLSITVTANAGSTTGAITALFAEATPNNITTDQQITV